MTRARRRSFRAWLEQHGAELLPLHQNEEARFRAQDTLCIVYAVNRRGGRSCVPALASEAFAAWEQGRDMDLRNSLPAVVTSHREQAAIVNGMVARLRAGEVVDVAEEAQRPGLSAERVERVAAAWGFRVAGGRIEPSSTRIAA